MVLIWGLRGDLVLVDQFGFCVWLHWYSIFSKSPTNVSKSSKTIKNVKPPSSPFTFYVASSFSLEFFITISHFLFGKHTIFVILLDSCYSSSLWMHPSNRNNTSSDYLLSFSLSPILKLSFNSLHWNIVFFFFVFTKVECVLMDVFLIEKWTIASLRFHLKQRIILLIPWSSKKRDMSHYPLYSPQFF